MSRIERRPPSTEVGGRESVDEVEVSCSCSTGEVSVRLGGGGGTRTLGAELPGRHLRRLAVFGMAGRGRRGGRGCRGGWSSWLAESEPQRLAGEGDAGATVACARGGQNASIHSPFRPFLLLLLELGRTAVADTLRLERRAATEQETNQKDSDANPADLRS